MRRICLTLLVSLAVVPAALAAPTMAGDGTVAAVKVSGTVTVLGHGVIWGLVDSGVITVTDEDTTDGSPKVVGYETVDYATPTPFSTRYTGTGMRFQLSGGGSYRITLSGTGIYFSAVGGGKIMLDGSDTSSNPGRYRLGDASWQAVPTDPTWLAFPAAPATTPATTTTTTGP